MAPYTPPTCPFMQATEPHLSSMKLLKQTTQIVTHFIYIDFLHIFFPFAIVILTSTNTQICSKKRRNSRRQLARGRKKNLAKGYPISLSYITNVQKKLAYSSDREPKKEKYALRIMIQTKIETERHNTLY